MNDEKAQQINAAKMRFENAVAKARSFSPPRQEDIHGVCLALAIFNAVTASLPRPLAEEFRLDEEAAKWVAETVVQRMSPAEVDRALKQIRAPLN
jgi:hypothetical protein